MYREKGCRKSRLLQESIAFLGMMMVGKCFEWELINILPSWTTCTKNYCEGETFFINRI